MRASRTSSASRRPASSTPAAPSKIAEHGGASADDRNVPIVVAEPRAHGKQRIGKAVETTQIAPTILAELGLDPKQLQAVRIEGTKTLPRG